MLLRNAFNYNGRKNPPIMCHVLRTMISKFLLSKLIFPYNCLVLTYTHGTITQHARVMGYCTPSRW